MENNFIFFWGGLYSQWYPSKFKIGDIEYNCCEQYMMAQKAGLFNDKESYEAIMKESDPKIQKAIGRKVKGFDSDKWNEVCRQIVYEANLAKFGQNPMLLKELMKAGNINKEIVEASPYDTIWGIGMGERDPDRFDKSKWKGTNWLGEAIMQVRKYFRDLFDNASKIRSEFMEQYNSERICCPNCGSKGGYSQTIARFIFDASNPESYKNLNNCQCSQCGNTHTFHDRVKSVEHIKK